ncbi:MAG: sugar ABC transporter permease [Deltaproteobacteria bacterium]|nr:sugar ABC transporter permease [Deltaproteobacteria bacterium]
MRPVARWHPYALLLPTALCLGAFVLVPVLLSFVMSLFAWDLLTPPVWVGLGNYRAIARGGLLGTLTTTLTYSILVVVGTTSLGLALALLLHRPGRWFAFVRSSVFSAYVVSWVSVALLWLWLLDPDNGLVSSLLRRMHLPRVGFLTDPSTALPTLAAVTVWKLTGYAMVLFTAGLDGVPRPLLEAAALDGANAWQRFRYVTWPCLGPTAAFVGTTSLIVSFQAFDVVRIMTQGGPVKATTLFVYAIYEQVFLDLRAGRASALTVVFFVVLLGLSLLQLRAWRAAGGPRA